MSQRLGGTAMALLYASLEAELRARRSVILEANFAVTEARPTLLRLQRRLPFAPFEVHCTAPAEVLVARYAARSGSRHAGHLDAQRLEEIAQAIVEGRNGPLELGADAVVLDTTDPDLVETATVVEAARRHLVRHGHAS